MAWVRIHDGAMQHPKILRLSDSAFRLWIWGLTYSQTHLTDGLIPREALRDVKHKRGDVDILTTAIADTYAPLWERVDGFGFKVHDYLFWNDSREKVRDRQVRSKARVETWREKHARNAVTNTFAEPVCNTTLTKPNQTKQEIPSGSRGEPPLNLGLSRLKVWRWMVDDCIRLLGDHAEAFDLVGFFQELDRRETRVIGVAWPWLREEVIAEAKRRKLPMASVVVGNLGNPSPYGDWLSACPHDPKCNHPTPCQRLQHIAAAKALA